MNYLGVEYKEITAHSFAFNPNLSAVEEENERWEAWYTFLYQDKGGEVISLIANAINYLVTPLIVKGDIIDGVVRTIPVYDRQNRILRYQNNLAYNHEDLKIYLSHNIKQIAKSLYEEQPLLIKMMVVIKNKLHYFEINQSFYHERYNWSGEEKECQISDELEILNKEVITYKKENK